MTVSQLVRSACAAGALLLAVGAHAQVGTDNPGLAAFARAAEANPPKPVAPPAIKPIPLASTGTQQTALWESMFGQTTVRNVTQPALYPILPPAGKANGTALVIAPGGGFLSLSFGSEGTEVARYLAERGITCFVLTYRLDATPTDARAFLQVVGKRFASAKPGMKHGDVVDSGAPPLAEADGLAAMRWVREHAGDYGIDPQRVGMIGFSAGGMTTMRVATAYDSASRPDFIGVIYGASLDRPVPKDAPPAFIAVAADDGLLGHASIPIFDKWRSAGKPAELHVYAAGEHGFGMRRTGTSADNWIQHFHQWLQASRLVPR